MYYTLWSMRAARRSFLVINRRFGPVPLVSLLFFRLKQLPFLTSPTTHLHKMKELFGRLRPHALAPVAEATEQPTIDLRSLPGSSLRAQVDEEVVTPSAQPGVQAIEATTQTWKKKHLVAAYAL